MLSRMLGIRVNGFLDNDFHGPVLARDNRETAFQSENPLRSPPPGPPTTAPEPPARTAGEDTGDRSPRREGRGEVAVGALGAREHSCAPAQDSR